MVQDDLRSVQESHIVKSWDGNPLSGRYLPGIDDCRSWPAGSARYMETHYRPKISSSPWLCNFDQSALEKRSAAGFKTNDRRLRPRENDGP